MIEGLCRLLTVRRGRLRTMINRRLSVRFSCSCRKRPSKVDLGLTWGLGLNIGAAGRAPEVHPWVRDVGCPGEIHRVKVIVNQTARLRTRINPVHIAIARRQKGADHDQEITGAAVGVVKFAERHKIRVDIVASMSIVIDCVA